MTDDLPEFDNLSVEDLNGTYKTLENKVWGVRNFTNAKGVKYGERIKDELEDTVVFDQAGEMKETDSKEGLESALYNPKYLKKLFKVMKACKAEKARFFMGEDLPLIAAFKTPEGVDGPALFLLAPRIQEE